MITIDYVYIIGFGSVVQELKYKFNRPGLNLIVGENGVGKTTILNALSWCLYKQPLRKGSGIEPWPHILNKDYEGTLVRTEAHDSEHKYEIIRCKSYKGKILGKKGGDRLIILQDGKEVEDKRDKKDAEKWIVEKLGYSFDLFKSSVLFGQRMKRLTEEDGSQKKKIFDEAFETTFISKAREIVDKRLKDKHTEHGKTLIRLEASKRRVSDLKNQLTQAKDAQDKFQERIDADLKEIESERKSLETQKGKVSKKINSKPNKDKLRDLSARISALTGIFDPLLGDREFRVMLQITQKETKIFDLSHEMDKLTQKLQNVPKTCSECNQPIPKETVKGYKENISKEYNLKKAKRRNLEEEVKGLKLQHKQLKKKLEVQQESVTQINSLKTELAQLEREQESLIGQISEIDRGLEKLLKREKRLLREKPPTFNVDEIRNQLSLAKKEVRTLKQEQKAQIKSIRVDEWLLKDPLSNAGLKAFIFDSLLVKVNNNLKAYKHLIGFGVKVYIEMASARKDICISVTQNGNEVPYEDLSGGQKQLVDVTLAFALHDTVQGIKPINILVLDELFESLSVNNVEIVGNIVQKVAQTKSVHMITHHKDFNPINSYRTYLTLEDGRTKIHSKYREN